MIRRVVAAVLSLWGIPSRHLSSIHRVLRTVLFRTDVGRWQQVVMEEPLWDARNRVIAQMIPANSSVIDLGSGAQTLERYLKPGCKYQPCDCVKSSDNVLLCDFNNDQYPNISQRFDYVVVSGLLEYIRDPRKFLGRIRSYGNVLLVSYAHLEPGQTHVWRASQGWLNHLTKPELERVFSDLDLVWHEVDQWHEQIIYHVQSG
jgi:hypothetical protein